MASCVPSTESAALEGGSQDQERLPLNAWTQLGSQCLNEQMNKQQPGF